MKRPTRNYTFAFILNESEPVFKTFECTSVGKSIDTLIDYLDHERRIDKTEIILSRVYYVGDQRRTFSSSQLSYIVDCIGCKIQY